MPTITTTFQTITPESAENGGYSDSGFYDEDGVDCSEDEDCSAVENAIDFLKSKEPLEPSNSSFCIGTWYTESDCNQDNAYFEEGEVTYYSYHLNGFSEEQEREIFKELT